MKVTLFGKILVGFIVAFVLTVALAALDFYSTIRLTRAHEQLEESKNRVILLEETASLVKDIQRSHRGFIVTRDNRFLDPYYNSLQIVGTVKARLMTEAWPERTKDSATKITALLDKKVDLAHEALFNRTNLEADAAVKKIMEGKQVADSIYVLTAANKKYELDAQKLINDSVQRWLTTNEIVISTSLVTFLLLLVIGMLKLAQTLKERNKLYNALQQTNEEIHDKNEELNLLVEGLNQTNATLSQRNQDLQFFSYAISHDLKSPLRKLKIKTENALETMQIDSANKETFQGILRSTHRLNDLVDKLLTYAHAGTEAISKERIDMHAMVMEIIEEVRADSTCEILVPNALHASSADPALIRQVWINLLTNAIKFSAGAESPRVQVTSQSAADYIEYSVSDNGVGFEQGRVNELFEIFKRLHDSQYAGSGIGLAIVKRIVVSHGGEVSAVSEKGKGSRFWFRLPRTNDA